MGSCQSTAGSDEYGQYIDHQFSKRWEMCNKVLGKGGFGEVHLVKHKKTKTLAAAKVLDKSDMKEDDIDAVKQEVMIMRRLQHPCLARFIDFFEEKTRMIVVMEYLEGGALFDRIVTRKHYTELVARDLIYICLTGLKQCHDQSIIHRDLKPENLILASTTNDTEVKIADFGLSVPVTESTKESRSKACGTPAYLAPEMVLAGMGQLEGGAYGTEVDMWSVGCLAYILLAGYPPFISDPRDPYDKKLYRAILRGDFDMKTPALENVSQDAKDLVKGLLCVDPKERLTAEQAIVHPWVQRARNELAGRNLDENMRKFRAFHGRQKFRAAVKGIIAAKRFKEVLAKLAESYQEENDDDEEQVWESQKSEEGEGPNDSDEDFEEELFTNRESVDIRLPEPSDRM